MFSRTLTRDEEAQCSPAAINLEPLLLLPLFCFSAADISHNDSHYSTHPTKFNNNLTFFFLFSFSFLPLLQLFL